MRVTLGNVAVLPGLAFDQMYFNCIQEKHDILMNRDGTWILNGRVHFVKFLGYSGGAWHWSTCNGGGDDAASAAAEHRQGRPAHLPWPHQRRQRN